MEDGMSVDVNTHKLLSNETIIPDDYPVHNIKEIRKCDIFGHPGAKLGDKFE